MLVDSPTSGLANSGVDMTGYIARANVFARLMTSAAALRYIGQAAGIPGNLIDANGPIETNGSAIASHAPVELKGGKDLPFPATYKLSLVQNPSLPTVDVYAQAPTTAQAISLANGAVTGFAKFVNQLAGDNVPLAKRIEVRQLGAATGGVVDPGASKKIAVLIFFAVLAMWCGGVLFVSRLRADLRAAKNNDDNDPFDFTDHEPFDFTGDVLTPDPTGAVILPNSAQPPPPCRCRQLGFRGASAFTFPASRTFATTSGLGPEHVPVAGGPTAHRCPSRPWCRNRRHRAPRSRQPTTGRIRGDRCRGCWLASWG